MILKETLRDIVWMQTQELKALPTGILRERLNDINLKDSFVTILSGVRRCGKSTLLRQLMKKTTCYYYFNFEDPRSINFEVKDFNKLEQIFHEEFGNCRYYFFDEIQNIQNWERFVRKLHDTGRKVIITGSNASLLSRELGDRLTGRHLSYPIFPFSYNENLNLLNRERSADSFKEYIRTGGFPEFLKFGNEQILHQLLHDIITRDIITRYQIRDYKCLLEMAVFLLTHVGKEFSYTRLKNHFGLGSVNTVINYIGYLENSYLLFTVPKFSFSFTKQRASLKKVYSVDTGLAKANSASLTNDKGRLLENIVFLHLKKKYNEIFYFRNNFECDFIVKEQGKITKAVQVCYQLNDDNMKREITGLKEAMKATNAEEGFIVTFDQKDQIEGITIVPSWQFVD